MYTRRQTGFSSRHFLLSLLFVFVFAISVPGRAAHAAEVIATRITPDNAQKLLSPAPDRMGGIGDWYLANEYIWAIVDDVEDQTLICPSGGSLIDLGTTTGMADQFVQMLQILNMNRDIVIPYDRVETEQGDGWAAIRVSTSHGLRPEQDGFGVPDPAIAQKILVETEYRLNAGERFLRVKTTVRNTSPKSAGIFNIADVIYWGDDTIKPFAASQPRLGSERGSPRGFHHPDIDTSNFISLLGAVGGYTYVAGGGVEGLPPVSYGLCSPAEFQKNHLLWGINDTMVSAIGIFTGEFRRISDIWKIPFFTIEAGKELTYERILVVGERNDVASATDILFNLLGKADGSTGVCGRIEPPQEATSITVFAQEQKTPVTQIRPISEGPRAGEFKAVLPPGDYIAEFRSAERDAELETVKIDPVRKFFTVTDSFTDMGAVQLPQQAAVSVQVMENGRHLPARVIIRGINGTPDPQIGSDLLGFTVGGKLTPSSLLGNWLWLSGKEDGPVRVGLRPGQYEILATHGFEYSVDRQKIELDGPDDEVAVTLELKRVVETPGMMTGDFHVHSVASMDSALSKEQRIASFVADGVELLVATDHDVLTDYGPTISRLGLDDQIQSIVGVEATSMLMQKNTPFTIGHYNAWPLNIAPELPKNGMVHDEGLRPRMLYERLSKIGKNDMLIQVNHGRGREPDGGASFFYALGTEFDKPLAYDPSKPMIEFPNKLLLAQTAGGVRDIDFDVMELLNGSAYDEYLLVKNDWFSLLNQGYNKTASGNSDTHIKAQLAGYPRNYILLDDPQAERADEQTIVHQIRNQRLFFTTGPIVHFTINNRARPGDLISPHDKAVVANLEILAAPWIPLDEVRVYANGTEIMRDIVKTSTDVVRFQKDIPLTLGRDTWLVVECSTVNKNGRVIPEPPGGLYNIIAPGFVPIALTNPIFIDIDGNGIFNPPGIPPTPASFAPPWQVKTSIVGVFLAIVSGILYIRRLRRQRRQALHY